MFKTISINISMWQYIGIILSILWALSAGFNTRNDDLKAAESFAKIRYMNCIYAKLEANDNNLSSCEEKREQDAQNWLDMGSSTGNAWVAALAPIPFGWLGGFILLYVVRAQIAGFRAVVPWKTLGKGKKLFFVFCLLVSFVAALFGLTALLNLYVDTRVPVSLSPFLDVTPFPSGNNIPTSVEVNGTWTRIDLTGDTIANPLQTSRVSCNRQERKCTEAKAYVSGNLLSVDLITYDIQSWSSAHIVFGNDDICGSETYTIDLTTKAITGAGHSINENTNNWCKALRLSGMGAGKDNWNLLLSNGFNVYWELRKKARPMLLRLIQTLFGN